MRIFFLLLSIFLVIGFAQSRPVSDKEPTKISAIAKLNNRNRLIKKFKRGANTSIDYNHFELFTLLPDFNGYRDPFTDRSNTKLFVTYAGESIAKLRRKEKFSDRPDIQIQGDPLLADLQNLIGALNVSGVFVLGNYRGAIINGTPVEQGGHYFINLEDKTAATGGTKEPADETAGDGVQQEGEGGQAGVKIIIPLNYPNIKVTRVVQGHYINIAQITKNFITFTFPKYDVEPIVYEFDHAETLESEDALITPEKKQ